MFKRQSKINKFRSFALILVFFGIGIMYLALYFRAHYLIMTIFMLLGFISVLVSSTVYLWVGIISTRTIQVTCPSCGKSTKVLGRVDLCMFCNEPLTVDPTLEGKPFDPKYNKQNTTDMN